MRCVPAVALVVALFSLVANAPARGTDAFALMGWNKLPNPLKAEGRTALDQLFQLRLARAPVTRGATVHIRYSPTGTGFDGNDGDGSPSNPYRCRTPAHVNDIIAHTQEGGDKCYDLGGDEYRRGPSSTGPATGVTLSADNCTIRNGILSGFDEAYRMAGWSRDGINPQVWWRTETTPVHWIIDAGETWDQTRASGGLSKWSSLAEVRAAPRRWWWDAATSRLYINTGNSQVMPGFVRPCKVSNSAGVLVTGNQCRLHNIQAYGWGSLHGPTNPPYILEFQPSAPLGEAVFSECYAHFGPWHAIGGYSGPDGASVLTCVDTDAGNCYTTNGRPTVWVSYAHDGNNELLLWRCRVEHATVDAPALRVNGGAGRYATGVYAHTTASGSRCGLQILRDCTFPSAPRSVAVAYSIADAAPPADMWDPSTYRTLYWGCVIETPTSEDSPESFNGMFLPRNSVQYRCRISLRPRLPMFGVLQLEGAEPSFGVIANSLVEIDGSLANDWNSLLDGNGCTVGGAFVFSRWLVRDLPQQVNFAFNTDNYGSAGSGISAWNMGDIKAANNIVTRQGPFGRFQLQWPRKRIGAAVEFPLLNPGETTEGGCSRNAVRGLIGSDIVDWYSSIALEQDLPLAYQPVPGDQLYKAADLTDLPDALRPDEDYYGQVRSLQGPSVGPIEQAPPACDPDVNCDGSADGFDLEAMEQAVGGDMTNFCQSNPDFNRDGSVDGFDMEALEQVVGGAACP